MKSSHRTFNTDAVCAEATHPKVAGYWPCRALFEDPCLRPNRGLKQTSVFMHVFKVIFKLTVVSKDFINLYKSKIASLDFYWLPQTSTNVVKRDYNGWVTACRNLLSDNSKMVNWVSMTSRPRKKLVVSLKIWNGYLLTHEINGC